MLFFHQRLVSRILIAVVLVAQVMLASHACERRLVVPAAATPAAALPGAEPDCDADSVLCRKHCQDEPGALDAAPHVEGILIHAGFEMPLTRAEPAWPSGRPRDPALVRATSPPTAIRHCCWRI